MLQCWKVPNFQICRFCRIWQDFFADRATSGAAKTLLKCVLDDDIRVVRHSLHHRLYLHIYIRLHIHLFRQVEVFNSVTFADLLFGLAQKYGTSPDKLVIRYTDSDGYVDCPKSLFASFSNGHIRDLVHIDGDGALQKALQQVRCCDAFFQIDSLLKQHAASGQASLRVQMTLLPSENKDDTGNIT